MFYSTVTLPLYSVIACNYVIVSVYFILGSSFLYNQDQRNYSGTKFRYKNTFALHGEVSCKFRLDHDIMNCKGEVDGLA